MSDKQEKTKATVKKSRKNPLQIDCEESLDISMVQELHEKLLKALNEDRPIVVNISKVEKVDASILQMFCVLSLTARHKNLKLEWQEPSQKFKDSVRLLDLGDSLELQAA